MPVKDLAVDLLVRYGFQVLGALVILGVGLVVARWLGSTLGTWLERHGFEPPAPWVAVTDWVPAPAELYQAIVARLQGSGLALATPRREVRLVNGGR